MIPDTDCIKNEQVPKFIPNKYLLIIAVAAGIKLGTKLKTNSLSSEITLRLPGEIFTRTRHFLLSIFSAFPWEWHLPW